MNVKDYAKKLKDGQLKQKVEEKRVSPVEKYAARHADEAPAPKPERPKREERTTRWTETKETEE